MRKRLPSWLTKKPPSGKDFQKVVKILENSKIFTVCREAKCPNRFECFSKKTATFLALGNFCTRSCKFCNILHKKNPKPPDPNEPEQIAKAVSDMKLQHVVITMVTRDDLIDGGAKHLATIIDQIRNFNKNITIEILTSDFNGKFENLEIVLNKNVDIFNHNIETVSSLTPKIRNKATYLTSLEILNFSKKSKKSRFVKSGFMVGLGEKEDEIFQTIRDLANIDLDILTIGQYLQPNLNKYPVIDYIHPEKFKKYKIFAQSLNIPKVLSSPFVRSSYNSCI